MTESAEWSWLEDTYWYVDDRWLPALELDASSNTLTWLVDQTVWHVTGYRDGYFWGVAAALLYPAGEEVPTRGPQSRPMGQTLVGTVTPQGSVEISFVGAASAPTTGFGRITEWQGQPAFEMQMAAGSGDPLRTHWAYMLQTREGEASWDSLPGVGLSVPEMLEGLEAPTVTTGDQD